jgi:zinc transporter, ZIP family
MDEVLWILALAALGPIIGSLIGVLKKPNDRTMFHLLAFSAGVMMAISFTQLIPESIEMSSTFVAVTGIIIGFLIMFLAGKYFVPTPAEYYPNDCELDPKKSRNVKLKNSAMYLLVGIFIHNIPEGMAMATGLFSNLKLSLVIAISIALHNIPEGICTSAPYYYATGKRLKAFLLSSSTAIPLVVGFFIAGLVYQIIPIEFVGLLVGLTAGVMLYVSADELIPTSCRQITDHRTIFAFMLGVIFVMLVGLI